MTKRGHSEIFAWRIKIFLEIFAWKI